MEQSECKEHEIYYESLDYDECLTKYDNQPQKERTQEELLLIAKAYFVRQRYDKCLIVLEKIEYIHSPKVLFERQSLQFRSLILSNLKTVPTQILSDLNKIIDDFRENYQKYEKDAFKPWHLAVFTQFSYFLKVVEDRMLSKIQFTREMQKEYEKQYQNPYLQEGFPSYLICTKEIKTILEVIVQRKNQMIYPINNFAIINHIFEAEQFKKKTQQYKNVYIFADSDYKFISKRLWFLFNSLLNGGKQFNPVKRIIKVENTTRKINPLVPIALKYDNKVYCFQLSENKPFSHEFYKIIQEKWGLCQIRKGVEIFDDQNKTQSLLANTNKILILNKIQLPSYLSEKQKIYALKFEIYPLSKQDIERQQVGLRGLQNLGNYCYMNACLQCFSFSHELAKELVLINIISIKKQQQNDLATTIALSDLLKGLWKKGTSTSLNPTKYKKWFGVKNPQFSEKTQEDAHQFLLCLLNCLHDELKISRLAVSRLTSKLNITTNLKEVRSYFERHELKPNNSKITQKLRGVIKNEMACSCGVVSHSFDTFLALTLPLPHKIVDSIDMYYCGYRTKATRKYRFYLEGITQSQQLLIKFMKTARIKKQGQTASNFIFGRINKQNLLFEQLAVFDESESEFIIEYSLAQLMTMTENSDLILYEARKKSQKDILYLCEYRLDKDGQILGFPKFIYYKDVDMKEKYARYQFQKVVVDHQNENMFLINDIFELVFKQTSQSRFVKNKSNIYQKIVQVIFKRKQKLFKGIKYFQDEINDPNMGYQLSDCFRVMSEPQILQDSWECGSCKKAKKVQKRQQIYQTGDLLIIHLKRFTADSMKIKTHIAYPIQGLDITKWIKNQQISVKNVYDLYAVCLHTGSASYGHYRAYCKHFITGKWYQFDDEIVKQVEEKQVVSPHAYMLFYRRKQI